MNSVLMFWMLLENYYMVTNHEDKVALLTYELYLYWKIFNNFCCKHYIHL